MGKTKEAKGIACTTCNVHFSPIDSDFEFIKACAASPQWLTFCYWTKTEHETAAKGSITVGAEGKTSSDAAEYKIGRGAWLFKYFRNVDDDKYYCSLCYAKRDLLRAKCVFLELAVNGRVVSTDFQLVKIGTIHDPEHEAKAPHAK